MSRETWTVGGVPCRVVAADGPAMTLRCPWDDSDTVMDALMGVDGQGQHWPTPGHHPDDTSLVAVECCCEPIGRDEADIAVTFAPASTGA